MHGGINRSPGARWDVVNARRKFDTGELVGGAQAAGSGMPPGFYKQGKHIILYVVVVRKVNGAVDVLIQLYPDAVE